jgi:hypothetical protein
LFLHFSFLNCKLQLFKVSDKSNYFLRNAFLEINIIFKELFSLDHQIIKLENDIFHIHIKSLSNLIKECTIKKQ